MAILWLKVYTQNTLDPLPNLQFKFPQYIDMSRGKDSAVD